MAMGNIRKYSDFDALSQYGDQVFSRAHHVQINNGSSPSFEQERLRRHQSHRSDCSATWEDCPTWTRTGCEHESMYGGWDSSFQSHESYELRQHQRSRSRSRSRMKREPSCQWFDAPDQGIWDEKRRRVECMGNEGIHGQQISTSSGEVYDNDARRITGESCASSSSAANRREQTPHALVQDCRGGRWSNERTTAGDFRGSPAPNSPWQSVPMDCQRWPGTHVTGCTPAADEAIAARSSGRTGRDSKNGDRGLAAGCWLMREWAQGVRPVLMGLAQLRVFPTVWQVLAITLLKILGKGIVLPCC
jgi:hypothetical protein